MAPHVSHRRSLLGWFRSGYLARGSTAAACWALLLQFVISLLHVPPTQAADADAPQWTVAPICHVEVGSLQPAAADQDQQPDKQAPHAHPVCPVCLGLHLAGTYVQPTFVVLPRPVATVAIHFSGRRHEESRAGLLDGSAQARAPPFA